MLKSIYDTYPLANGAQIPCMAFGTYLTKDGEKNIHTVAIDTGYRFFDTASLYETERSLGEAIKESGIKRDDLFIQSKLWYDERGYAEAKEALQRTLDRTGLDYLDTYLLHWPKASEDESDWEEKNLDTWRAMEECQKEGLIKGMGVSNFLPHHIKSLVDGSGIKPLVDQLELHIGYAQHFAVSYCKENDIVVQAWAPLSRGSITGDATFSAIARKYNKTASQICLRYLVQKGIIPIVKASNPEHMKQNMEIFDFELSFEEMSLLESYPYPAWQNEHPDLKIPVVASNKNQ